MSEKKPVRVWADGCYDLFHWGHANSLRQAKVLGDKLVVGIHTDEEIAYHKGPPVMSLEERVAAVKACKWVDEVVIGAPYVTQLSVLDEHNIDFCVHGEDVSSAADGSDTYAQVKQSGRYKSIKRTEGVSTTKLVGRMLLMTKEHHTGLSGTVKNELEQAAEPHDKSSPYTGLSDYVPTSKRLVQFASGKEPKSGDRIVYIDGAFDLFHPGHAAAIAKAHEFGDFVIVGVHTDTVVNAYRGANFPIMNLHERVLSVLSCRSTDEVVIGAPFHLTREYLENLHVDVVVHGQDPCPILDGKNPYKAAKDMGIYAEFDSGYKMHQVDVIQRVIDHRYVVLNVISCNSLAYEKRNKDKEERERAAASTTTATGGH